MGCKGCRLEQFDRQHFINIGFLPMPHLVKRTTFLVSTSKVTVLKNLYSLYIHVIRPKRRRSNKFFLPPHKSNRWLYLNMRWTNQILFFKGIWRWPLINLVILIHGYSYSISLEITVGYGNLRSSRNTDQFNVFYRKNI